MLTNLHLIFRWSISLLVLSVLTACASVPNTGTASSKNANAVSQPLTFVVIGDTPYNLKEDLPMLEKATQQINAEHPPFVIHLGDTKGGGQECLEKFDDNFANLIHNLSPIPVFYTPGDNEWVDCDRFKHSDGTRYSELSRLQTIKSRFFATPPVGSKPFHYHTQKKQIENAAWHTDNVWFFTLHVTGTNNARNWVGGDDLASAKTAVEKREAANLEWLKQQFIRAKKHDMHIIVLAMQSDMTDVKPENVGKICTQVTANGDNPCDAFAPLRQAIAREANNFEGQVLLIHGDTAPFTLQQSFLDDEAPNLFILNAAGDAGIDKEGLPYGVRDVTKVTITPGQDPIFSAEGLLTGTPPEFE